MLTASVRKLEMKNENLVISKRVIIKIHKVSEHVFVHAFAVYCILIQLTDHDRALDVLVVERKDSGFGCR